ncbi:MAG TPA: T9SS type A sorting domain-containing protein [Bacteroidia bacterium]|jgi:hypothetical protein|nr:T9SS type A sorting domain-containing protein [Bacteroidia bacterium]
MKKLLFTCLGIGFSLLLQAQWTHMGPFKDNSPTNYFVSGRLDCITPTPTFNGTNRDTLYAGSMSGSLWITTDFCATWNPVHMPDNVTFHGISALEGNKGGYMLVATYNQIGDGPEGPNGNIYQYFPTTGTWVASDLNTVDVTPLTAIHHIRVCPTNASIVMAATSTGLFRSINGGLNWTLVQTGAFENVNFVPATFTSSGYLVYASGNDVMVSNDFGITFTSKTSITSLLASGSYTDLAVTYNLSSSNTQYLYLDGVISGTSHHLIRLSVDKVTAGLETVDDYGLVGDGAASLDRMCLMAYDKNVYFGAGGVMKLNTYATPTFYEPYSQNYDQLYYGSPYVGYNVPEHSDNHDIIILPNFNTIIYVSDGGCFVNNYTDAGGGNYYNLWSVNNYNLNISQVLGLSCAEEDPTEFMTGEQDTHAFITNTANATYYASVGVEPSCVLIDKFNKNNFFQSSNYSSEFIVGTYNGASLPGTGPYLPNATGGSICNSTYSQCSNNGNYFSCFPAPEYSSSTFYQNPNEQDKVYFGTKNDGLTEFCPSTLNFTVKKQFDGNKWEVYPNGLAFSKANKNKVYAITAYRNYTAPDTASPFVWAYNDVDFDNSWYGHNDNWLNISPSYKVAPFVNPEPNIAAVQFAGIVASDWNPNTIWVAVEQAPANPSVKVIQRLNGVWQDYSTGIPSGEQVVSMVYEQGSDDQIYLGTNVNVYYRNAGMPSWVLYSTNLPNIAMLQLKINYTENTLRVGTYGQGMWKSNLACPGVYTATINGIETTSNFYEAINAVTVSGYTLNTGSEEYRSTTNVDFLANTLLTASSTATAFAFIHGCSGPGNTFRKPETSHPVTYEETMTVVKKQQPPISVFPNPNDGHFTVMLPVADQEEGLPEEANLTIYDLMGKIVYSNEKPANREVRIDLSDKPKGIYVLRCVIGDEVSTVRISNQ